jgi:antitoxin (DNA-binding transcriptional repressor) of toxin-antitoxin stability system
MEMTAGIRDLKNNLSHYLREVKKGRSVTAIERGIVGGTIVPGRANAGENVMFSCLMLASPLRQESSSAVYEIGKSSAKSGALSA